MGKLFKKTITFIMAGTLTLSAAFPAMNLQAEEDSSTMNEGSNVTQFMDCIEPMPITEPLSSVCWGAPEVGKRDQGNGLEDRKMEKYSYWDGGIIKDDDTGKYYMFASRWNQAGGHWGQDGISGWQGSQAVYAVSDNLYGPYVDKGPLWPEWCDGAGHNVFPFALSESDPLYKSGYRYAISISDTGMHGKTANGTIHIAKSLEGSWDLIENGNDGKLKASGGRGFSLSNISIMVRPDGKYQATNRNGDIAIAESLSGTWEVKENGLWETVSGMPSDNIEDPVIWYSDGLYHIVANKWDTRRAYYLTSEDGITNWKRHPGTAYTPDAEFLKYDDGTVNNWAKIERPNIYVEDGKITAMIFAVIDVEKEKDFGNDQHGSKVIVVPFSSEKLTGFAMQPDPLDTRDGILPIADTNSQSYGSEINLNYGAESFLQLQKDTGYQNSPGMGILGEGIRPDEWYDNKVGYLKYDISSYNLSYINEIDNVYLSFVYMDKPSGNAEKQQIQVTLSNSDWAEGIGRKNINANYSAPGTLTWSKQPSLIYDAKNIENTTAISEEFNTADVEKEVKIDVTKLVKQFMKENPGETVLSFALNATVTGTRIRLGSKEIGDTYAPKIIINKKDTYKPELLPIADTNTQSWGDDIIKNYGAEPYFHLQKDINYARLGLLGEGTRPDEWYDSKIGYLKYDISPCDWSNEVDRAYLSMIYREKRSGDATTNRVQAVLSDSNWEEGSGRSTLTDDGGLIWLFQPSLLYDATDIENTSAMSDEFSTPSSRGADTEVTIDVTNLVNQYKAANPDSSILSFALNVTETGSRLRFYSKESGDDYAPKLVIHFKETEKVAPGVTTATLTNGTVGKAYSQTLAATGNSPITWSIPSGKLPDGLNISEAGIISGTPKAAGTFSFTVKATNGTGSGTKEFNITVNPPEIVAPDITTTTLEDGTVEKAYSQTLTAKGGTPITWSISSGKLPDGLSLSATGIVSGTPKAAGTFTFTVKATNDAGSSTKVLKITVGSQNATKTCAQPTANKKNKTYTGSVSVTLKSTTKGARIYYTTDGKNPTKKSKYITTGKNIKISKTTTLKFMAVATGYKNSKVTTVKYTIKTAAPDKKAVPVSKTVKRGGKITLKAPKDVTLYYTVNGKNPSTKTKTTVGSGKQTQITITKKTTLQVIAVKKGCTKSVVVKRTYNVK